MESSVRPSEKVKELFTYEINRADQSTKWIGVTESGRYYRVESHEYNIGAAYSVHHTYYPIEPGEVDYYRKVADGRKRNTES